MGVTVGEQYQQLWEAASEAERRPKKHAEEQELDQLDLDHAKQGILVDFHTHTQKKPHNIGHQGRDDTFSKVGEKIQQLAASVHTANQGSPTLKALLCQHPSSLPLQIPLLGAHMIRKPVPGSKASNTG